MPGRHAEPQPGSFLKELVVFGLKVLFWGLVVIAAILVFQRIPGLSGDDADLTGETTAVAANTSVAGSPITTLATLAETTTTTEAVLEPPEVTVLVLNSTRRSGLAGRLSASIASLGYQMLEADNYPTLLPTSVLWYASGFAEEAEELARVLPEMIVEPNPEAVAEADLVIVLGESFEE